MTDEQARIVLAELADAICDRAEEWLAPVKDMHQRERVQTANWTISTTLLEVARTIRKVIQND